MLTWAPSRYRCSWIHLLWLLFLEARLPAVQPPPPADSGYYSDPGGGGDGWTCECRLLLRRHRKGPDPALKGNFDPVELGPLERVSSDQFQVIHQSTNRAARGSLLFFLSFFVVLVFSGCMRPAAAVVDVTQVVTPHPTPRVSGSIPSFCRCHVSVIHGGSMLVKYWLTCFR